MFPLVLTLLSIAVIIVAIFYVVSRAFGFSKVGAVFATVVGLSITGCIAYVLVHNNDAHPTKEQVRNMLLEEGIVLEDDFTVVDYESSWSSTSVELTVAISGRDKVKLMRLFMDERGAKCGERRTTDKYVEDIQCTGAYYTLQRSYKISKKFAQIHIEDGKKALLTYDYFFR